MIKIQMFISLTYENEDGDMKDYSNFTHYQHVFSAFPLFGDSKKQVEFCTYDASPVSVVNLMRTIPGTLSLYTTFWSRIFSSCCYIA